MNISLRKSVRRNIMLLALLLGSVLSLSAQQVTQEAALKKAEQFLGKTNISRRAPHKAPQLTLANNRDEFYIFNDKANGGYVIVSGEERMPDVLAYSYDSRFDADNIPCNMKAWLEGYAEQVKYLRTHPEASARRTTPERENVGPLLTCRYNQWPSPYNDKCPEVDGKRCPTGCTATAMAQIMYYWKWPEQTTDVIPGYTSYTHNIEMPAIPVTTIDWDNMLGRYGNGYTEKQADAISTLMLLCGTSVKMNYTPTGSGASVYNAAKAFRKYFGYDDLIEGCSRSAYSIEDWEQLVYDEMKSKRPVLYSGFSTDGSGHAFVLDGYQDGFFHVNWGWGGADAYVLMTDADGWQGYTEEQDAVVGIQPASADYPSRYAVIDNGTMTLYYDKKKSSRSGTVLVHKDDWVNYREKITECVIDKSFANLKQRDLYGYFQGYKNLKSIKGLKYLDTSETSNMAFMFEGCESLTSLDVSGFKTDKVTSMFRMFYGCSGLTSLDVSGFRTDNVTDMGSMFDDCSSLTSLDVSGFKTDNVTDMGGMFGNCSNLTKLDVSGFKTDKVTSMNGMFYKCSGLTSLDVSGFKTDNVTSMRVMFYGCSGLTSLDVSGFKTDNVTDMSWMFGSCSGLTELDVSGFKTDNVTDMSYMFAYCNQLATIYASERWNMGNVEEEKKGNMFAGCYKIIGGEGTTYDSDHVNDDYARIDEGPSKPGYFTKKAPQYYTITYMVDDEEYVSHYIKVGTTITAEAEPTKEGYTFSGWSEIPETMPAHDVTVTGTFSVNKYKLIYMVDGEEYKTSEVEYGTTITAEEEPTKEGYTFSGWSEIPETMPAHDVTVTGTFSVNKYKLIYMVDGEEYKTSEVEYGTAITAEAEPTKEGYTFSGWSEIPETMPAHDVTVTGTFSVNKYKLIYMVDGEEYKTSEVEYGTTITAEEEPTKEGYTFSGWSEIPETMPAHDVTVTGTFTINKYKLTYEVDGEEYKTFEVEYGTVITAEAEPTKEGYTFSGWSEIPETMPAHDVTVTGTFTINKYTITYMIDDEVYQTESVDYGSTITPPNAPEREGYTFEWIDVPETMPAHDITIIGSYTSGINAIRKESENGKVYDLNGRQVKTPRKGVYIINGKKMVVK